MGHRWSQLQVGVLAVLLLLTGVAPIHALELPLGGHYRVGKYMPVRVEQRGEGKPVRIEGTGVMTSDLAPGVGMSMASVFVVQPIRELRVDGIAVPTSLRELLSEERLVGYLAGTDVAIARQLFKTETIVPIRLNATEVLRSPPAAWDALDALVLDEPAYRALPRDKRDLLLAAGVVLVVRSDERPESPWNAEPLSEHWVIQYPLRGPLRGGVNADAFTPVMGDVPKWPSGFRVTVMVLGLIAGIVVMGAALIAPKRAWMGVVLAGTISAAGVFIMTRQRPVEIRQGGSLIIADGQLRQQDRWDYFTGVEPARSAALAYGPFITRPYFESIEAADASGLRLHLQSDGTPERFSFNVNPHLRAAFLSRRIDTTEWGIVGLAHPTGPIARLGMRLYMTDEDWIVGRVTRDGKEGRADPLWGPIRIDLGANIKPAQ